MEVHQQDKDQPNENNKQCCLFANITAGQWQEERVKNGKNYSLRKQLQSAENVARIANAVQVTTCLLVSTSVY